MAKTDGTNQERQKYLAKCERVFAAIVSENACWRSDPVSERLSSAFAALIEFLPSDADVAVIDETLALVARYREQAEIVRCQLQVLGTRKAG